MDHGAHWLLRVWILANYLGNPWLAAQVVLPLRIPVCSKKTIPPGSRSWWVIAPIRGLERRTVITDWLVGWCSRELPVMLNVTYMVIAAIVLILKFSKFYLDLVYQGVSCVLLRLPIIGKMIFLSRK